MPSQVHDRGIAIVGIGCRFPGGVDSPAAFWRLLAEAREAIGPMPPGRFDLSRLVDAGRRTPGRVVTADGGFLEAVDRFDAAFFGISPREAKKMDPQHRLLLEVVWEALEDGGIVPPALAGSRTGVYVGLWSGEYEHMMARRLDDVDLYATTGGGRYAAAGRISFALDLRGPSMTVDTACSSSLVAVHLGRNALLSGEADVAVAAAANLILHPFVSVGYSYSGMLSPGGRCRFGAPGADGYVRSEGAAALILKRVEDAVRDGDPIYAVVLGSAVNSDGRASEILVAPSTDAQEALLRAAYAEARIDPAEVAYVEAHGTGTAVGDVVELTALGRVLGVGRADGPLPVGSVKRLIGHTEAASGLAGLIKAALALDRGVVPAGGHERARNPEIPWGALNVDIATNGVELGSSPRRPVIGVNSFGVTGTNAHVILGKWSRDGNATTSGAMPAAGGRRPKTAWGMDAAVPRVVTLSARSPEALRAGAERLVEFLAANGDVPLADVSWTITCRRAHHEHRLAVAAATVPELRAALEAYLTDGLAPGVAVGKSDPAAPPRIGFVFSGQGSQWAGMARELLRVAPAFAEAIRECEAALSAHVDWSLRSVLEHGQPALERVDVVQPVLGAVQIALARQLEAWGVRPAAVVGHSMGEVAAAHVAGALSLEDTMRVLALRSRLLAEIAGRGAMALVDIDAASVRDRLGKLGGRVSIAAINGPRSTVVAGDPDAVDALLAELEAGEVFCRRVKVDVASHSAQTDPLLSRLRTGLAGIEPATPSVTFYSTVLAEPIGDMPLDAAYWARNLRRPVRLADAVGHMMADGIDAFVEISPHPILLASVADVAVAAGRRPVTIPLLVRGEPEPLRLLSAVATLYTIGAPVAWDALAHPDAAVVHLPGYAWQRESHWLDYREEGATAISIGAAPSRPAAADTSVWAVDWERAGGDVEEAHLASGTGLPNGRHAHGPRGRWLILADEGGVAERFAELVAAGGDRPVLLPFRHEFLPDPARDDETDARLALSLAIEQALANGTDEPAEPPACLVNLWPLDARCVGDSASIEACLARACGAAAVVMSVLETGLQWSGPTWWVTRGAQAVGARPVDPEAVAQAALWGFVRSAMADYPALDAHLLDLDPATPPSDAAADLLHTLRELPSEHQIGYEGRTACAARLTSADGDATRAPAVWRRDAAYLITGGFGGVGAEVARAMVRAGATRLVLAARTVLPPRREWGSADISPAIRSRIRIIRELEELGASVHHMAVDVADETALQAALRDYATEQWPPIRGIVHCVGEVEPGHTYAALRRMAHGKVLGAWNLYCLLPDVEHVVLFSSFVSAIPEPGQSAYAAVNAVLDSLASAWRARGTRAVSLSWGIWRETGMMREEVTARYRGILAQNGVGDMDVSDATALFHWLADSPRHHLVAAHVDWAVAGRRLRDRRGSEYFQRVLADVSGDGDARALRDELLGMPTEAAAKRLAAAIREMAGRIMHVAPSAVVATQALGRQGIDSLMAMELRNRLEIELGLTLPASVVWNYPSPVQLAAHLLERLAGPRSQHAGAATDARVAGEPSARQAAGESEPFDADAGAAAVLAHAERALAGARALSDDEALLELRQVSP